MEDYSSPRVHPPGALIATSVQDRMKTAVLVNVQAGGGEQVRALRTLVSEYSTWTVWECHTPDDLEAAASRLQAEGYEQVVAAGGDGTVHALVNALMQHDVACRVGVLPVGTGNDLARTLALPGEPDEALEVLRAGREQHIDLMRVETEQETRYGVNAAAGGFGGQVDEALTSETKATWGPLAYLVGAVKALPDLHDYETFIAFNDGERQRVDALNVVVANGRTAAGGKRVAPLANPCDGALDVVVVRNGSVAELAEVGTRLMTGNYLESPLVTHRQVRAVHVASKPGMWFNVDGELLTKEPVTISVLPGALRVVVGPAFQPVPDREAEL